jgi:CheY-like chemotaxis protein
VLIELLEKLGVNLELTEVRDALKDIHRLGSANIPDLWLTDEQMAEQGLILD